ncbi:MAG: hypothetical protein NTU44_05630 [Bacteroidetes bacterium]|nr:hypothetical protein [Bacteroidota bacterium]
MIKSEIQQVLEALSEQWEIVSQYEGKIPQIEVDLILANIRDLYEAVNDLRRKNDQLMVPPSEHIRKPIPPPIITPISAPVEIPVPAPVHTEPPVPEVIITEPPFTVLPPEIPEKPFTPVQRPPEEHPFRPPKPSPDLFSINTGSPTISDKLREDKTTLNDRLQQEKHSDTLGNKLNQNPIKDLKSSIGINEKFQFINELFNGSMQDYTQAIAELNVFGRLEEATEFVDILKFKYNWDTNSDAYHKIMDFIRRRYL